MRFKNLSTLCFSACICFLPIGSAKASEILTVAFVGDQGTNKNARAVLQLVADGGADLLLIQGDLGYGAKSATRWIQNIEGILGSDFPVILTVGNHENFEWPVYQQWLIQRIRDVPDLICQGNPGVKAHCSFRGLSVVQVAAGVDEVSGIAARDDYAAYLENELSDASNVWRVCSWHKNQQNMQVGVKPDETGWEIYAACLKHGGIVAMAHEHSYSRTYLMNDFENQVVAHREAVLEIGPGSSFAFVSGLGGHSIRKQRKFEHWWASVYTASQDASYGALFCTFSGKQANCEFKDINGVVPDRFALENRNNPGDKVVLDKMEVSKEVGFLGKMGSMVDKTGLLLLVVMMLLLIHRASVEE